MAVPTLTLTIRDPGLGLAGPSVSTPLVIGPSSSGTANTIVVLSDLGSVVDEFGEGPMPEDACRILSAAGGPIYAMKSNASVAGAAGAVSKTAVAGGTGTGTVTVAGAAYDAYEAVVEITTTGTVGVGAFRYSLDGGRTYSEPITIPAATTYVVPRTNLTLTFVVGGGPVYFEDGDVHTFTCTAPAVNATNLGDALTAAQADSRTWRFAHIAGRHGDAAASATLAGTLSSQMTTAQTAQRYTATLMDAGSDVAATTVTAFAAVAHARVGLAYGTARRVSLKPFTGWGEPLRHASGEIAARLAAGLASTHAGRVASGPLDGVSAISHDARTDATMHDAGFATLRTWRGLPGFYPTAGRIKAPAGSDFQRFELRFVMDIACSTAVEALTTQANKSVRVLTDGTGRIDPRDAAAWRQVALSRLRSRLTEPLNAEGVKGHVSGLDVTVDQTNNVLTSGQVLVTVALVPLGYAETIAVDVGYATTL